VYGLGIPDGGMAVWLSGLLVAAVGAAFSLSLRLPGSGAWLAFLVSEYWL
jgi:hypothetical protein